MKVIELMEVELKKLKRSKIVWILLAAILVLWLPSILHAELNFGMQAEGIAPEYNFFVQGFMGMAWFIFPASIIVSTVLLNQTERKDRGLQKMLSLPVSTKGICLAKFAVLLVLSLGQILLSVGMYYVSAGIASQIQGYAFCLSPMFVLPRVLILWAVSIPMSAFFWVLSVCIQTPVFSMGIGLMSIVPSVLVINTKLWYAYPMSYPFFYITGEYGKLAENLSTAQIQLFPWIPVAFGVTMVCLFISCLCFGRKERR